MATTLVLLPGESMGHKRAGNDRATKNRQALVAIFVSYFVNYYC